MKAARALECPKCGAPVEAIARFCTFCGVPLAPTEEAVQQDRERRNLGRAAFCEALGKMLAQGTAAHEALRAASAAHLETPLSEPVINATLAIARDFEARSKCSVVRDANVLQRIAEAYERVRAEAERGSTTLNLPFLAANETGPKHLSLELGPSSIAALEARR